MKEFSENTNLEIYHDLEKQRWFKKAFPNIESFDYRNYETGKKYFQYQKVKGQIKIDFIIYKTNITAKIKRLIWFIFWVIAIYKLYFWSFIADYFLVICVLGGYGNIYQTGAWDKKTLRIDKTGCEIDGAIHIDWNEISYFVAIPYLMKKETDYIFYIYIILENGILYKFNFLDFAFGNRSEKNFLPYYIEYFREQSLNY
jgi:hypothetical protein